MTNLVCYGVCYGRANVFVYVATFCGNAAISLGGSTCSVVNTEHPHPLSAFTSSKYMHISAGTLPGLGIRVKVATEGSDARGGGAYNLYRRLFLSPAIITLSLPGHSHTSLTYPLDCSCYPIRYISAAV